MAELFNDAAKWGGMRQKCAFLFDVHCVSPGIQGVQLHSSAFFPKQNLSCKLIFSIQSGHHLIPTYSFYIQSCLPSVFKNQQK